MWRPTKHKLVQVRLTNTCTPATANAAANTKLTHPYYICFVVLRDTITDFFGVSGIITLICQTLEVSQVARCPASQPGALLLIVQFLFRAAPVTTSLERQPIALYN